MQCSCPGWQSVRIGKVSSSRVGKQSADVCLQSPFHPAWVRTPCSQQHAGLAGKELGGTQASWWFPVQRHGVLGGLSLLLLLVWLGAGRALCWQLAGWWQTAAGVLRCHRFFTGSCYPDDPSASLLLSVVSFVFLVFLPLKQTVHAFLILWC